jgi:hypothetical protein
MEEAIVLIVHILLGAPTPKVGLIMYSIINFNVWLTIVDELFVLEPSMSSFKPRWNKLSARIRPIKDMRDRLAHEAAHVGEAEAVLRPSEFDVRPKTTKYQPLTIMEISDFSSKTADIGNEIVQLVKDMQSARAALREKSPE